MSAGAGHADLLARRRTVTSQWGEDGLLEEVFRRIGARNRVCIELGAGDGRSLSNTWRLWHDEGWTAVLLEGDAERAAALAKETAGRANVRAVGAFVEVEGPRSLEALVAPFGVPDDLDLLSLDIDGDDWHLWDALKRLCPRVVVVEYNPTIPPEVDVVQPRGERFGASAKALVALGHRKGYRLAALTETNVVMVHEDSFPALGFPEPALEEVFPRGLLTYLVTSFDGATFLTRTPIFLHKLRGKRVVEARKRDVPHPTLPPEAGLVPVHVRTVERERR